MTVKQSAFKFNTVRCQSNRIAGGRERKCFEITADQQIDGIGCRYVYGRIALHGVGKCHHSILRGDDRASVTDLEINCLIALDGKNLDGGCEFIEFSELNISAHQNLNILLLHGNLSEIADHSLVIFDQFFTSNIEFRLVNRIKMLRKIVCGKLGDASRADMGKRSLCRAVAQSHNTNLAVIISGAGILEVRQVVSRRIFAILRYFPISIHVCLPIS